MARLDGGEEDGEADALGREGAVVDARVALDEQFGRIEVAVRRRVHERRVGAEPAVLERRARIGVGREAALVEEQFNALDVAAQGGRVERCFLFVVEPQRIGAEREEVAREADVGAFECGLELLREVVGAAVDDIKTAVLCDRASVVDVEEVELLRPPSTMLLYILVCAWMERVM